MKVEAVALLVAVVFAGCTGDDSGASDLGAVPGAAALGLGESENLTANKSLAGLPPPVLYSGPCTVDAAVLVGRASQADAQMPSGFTAARLADGGAEGASQPVVMVVACANQTWNGTDLGPTLAGMEFVVVEPPEEFLDEANITLYFLGRMVTASEGLAEVLGAWGLGDLGAVAAQGTLTAAGRVGQFSATIGGLTFQATTEVAANTGPVSTVLGGAPEGEATYRFFAPVNGLIEGYADITLGASSEWFGSSQVSPSAGSGAFANPAMAGVAIYRFGPAMTQTIRYVPLGVGEPAG